MSFPKEKHHTFDWTIIWKALSMTLKLSCAILNWESWQKQLDQQPQTFQGRVLHILWPEIPFSNGICNELAKDLILKQFIIQGYLCKNIWVMLQPWCIIPRYLQNIIGSIFCTIDKEEAWFFYFFKDPYLCVREHEWGGVGQKRGTSSIPTKAEA